MNLLETWLEPHIPGHTAPLFAERDLGRVDIST